MRGKKYWVIPDCELPEEGEGQLKGHESVIVLNGQKTGGYPGNPLLYGQR